MMETVAIYHSLLKEKFGVPRQSGLTPHLKGTLTLEKEFNHPQALKGLEGFDFLWLIWGFHLNGNGNSLTVRPPRLGGNATVGVFASRSPFRPNGMGLSSVRIENIDAQNGIIIVSGADLVDGTPVFDIKPYVPYTDSHPEARSGFVEDNSWETLEVTIPPEIAAKLGHEKTEVLTEILRQDPRPSYQDDPSRFYGLSFDRFNVRFRVEDRQLFVTEAV